MDKKSQLTRTCLACGEKKPLAAFLQLSGAQGTVYGNICSSCRSAEAKNKGINIASETDERGSSGSGKRIDAKAKIQKELDDKLALQKIKELEIEESKKLEKIALDKIDKTALREKAEKDHRTTYIEAKQKRSFLDYQQKKTPPSATMSPQERAAFEAQQNEESQKKELNQTTDFSSGASIDPGVAGIRFQLGESQQRLEALLGKSAFMSRMKNTFGAKADDGKKTAENAKEKDPLVDYVKDNLKPTSQRRGR